MNMGLHMTIYDSQDYRNWSVHGALDPSRVLEHPRRGGNIELYTMVSGVE